MGESTTSTPKDAEPKATESHAEPIEQQQTSINNFGDTVMGTVNASLISTIQDSRVRENQKFNSQEAYREFDYLKKTLNQYLRNWIKRKKPKQKFEYEEIDMKVRFVLGKIHKVISDDAHPDFKKILSETTYRIGVKGDKRRYGFKFADLKKDFDF